MAISIRLARTEDADQLYEMICDLARYERAEDNVAVTAADLRRQMSERNPPFECAIAEIKGKPYGFALYFFGYSTWEGARTLYLEDLYVHQQFRGEGVGAALMLFLALLALRCKCRRFEWSVMDWNESAIGFYQRLGAKPVPGWTKYRMDADSIETLLRGNPHNPIFKFAAQDATARLSRIKV